MEVSFDCLTLSLLALFNCFYTGNPNAVLATLIMKITICNLPVLLSLSEYFQTGI